MLRAKQKGNDEWEKKEAELYRRVQGRCGQAGGEHGYAFNTDAPGRKVKVENRRLKKENLRLWLIGGVSRRVA